MWDLCFIKFVNQQEHSVSERKIIILTLVFIDICDF